MQMFGIVWGGCVAPGSRRAAGHIGHTPLPGTVAPGALRICEHVIDEEPAVRKHLQKEMERLSKQWFGPQLVPAGASWWGGRGRDTFTVVLRFINSCERDGYYS